MKMTFNLQTKELTPLERIFKNLFIQNHSRRLDAPCSQDEIMDILTAACSKNNTTESVPLDTALNTTILEHTFIQERMDAAFVRHLRYIPAFWHKHDFFELLFVLEGQCTNSFLSRTIQMLAGDICIMAPNVSHAVSAFSDNSILLNIVIRRSTFEKSFFGLLESDCILSDFFKRVFYETTSIPYLLFHTGNDRALHQYVQEAYEEYGKNRRFKNQMINAFLSSFFIVLFRNHEQNIEIPSIQMNSSSENLIYILRYMQSNYTTITLKELSAFSNYSERQLQRLIQKATGSSFRENIQKQKIIKSAELLANSRLSISQICEQTGFESLNNFRKIFYKYYQMTPSVYRKQSQP